MIDRNRILNSSLVVCIENLGQSKWLRTQPLQNKTIVVESSSYGDPKDGGYSMVFDTPDEYISWLEERNTQGWIVTFVGDSEPLSEEILAKTHSSIIEGLRRV